MATRKRVGRLKGHAIPQTSSSTQAVNTWGFPALADEIYLEIILHMPSVPIPTSISSPLHPEIRRSRHETLLSLSQTSRSLRRFFWRYLWQRIEVREGIKINDGNNTFKSTPYLGSDTGGPKLKQYSMELVRQLEIVTIRNPQLAQYVNYLDVFIGEYSFDSVLAELARCLSLFSNLHTVQIDVTLGSRRSLGKIFDRIFNKYSYPQIRNVFVMPLSQSLIASCPEARRVNFTQQWSLSMQGLHIIADSCPQLEVLEDNYIFWRADYCKLIVDSFPNLRSVTISPLARVENFSRIEILKKLNHLQTIIVCWKSSLMSEIFLSPAGERNAREDKSKEDWIETVKHILIHIQLRDNLEKTLVIRDSEGERQISIKPIEK